jgi:hypothetical protein
MSHDYLADANRLQEQIFVSAERIRRAAAVLHGSEEPLSESFCAGYIQEVVSRFTTYITEGHDTDVILGNRVRAVENPQKHTPSRHGLPPAFNPFMCIRCYSDRSAGAAGG